jgi:outer membrane lipoprotein-sorting protein
MRLFCRIFSIAIFAALFCGFCRFHRVSQQSVDPSGLDAVLKKMDAAAASFRTTQADFAWEQYQKVVDETDTQEGTVYYRRSGSEIEMMAEIKKPDRKFVLYKDGELKVYQPKIEQVMVHPAGKNRAEIESYLVLGFGGSGQDLTKSFDVTYQGSETVNNIATAKLQLVPKSDKLRNTFARIILWIDLQRGISVQQQFFELQGDYRLAKYSGIRVNEKINNDVFQLKTTSKTQTVSPRS